jgi:hypothetical protein
VCVGVSSSTTVSDDPSSSALCVVCIECFPRGAGMPPLVTCSVRHQALAGAAPQIFFFGQFFLFLEVY